MGLESLQESSGTWDLPKLLKELSYVDVWPFYGKVVRFPMPLYEPHTFEWENCWEFQTTLKPLSQFCSNFIWSHFRVGKQKIAKIVAVCWPRWPPCPYMVKTFKIFFSRTENAWGWIFAQIIGDERSTKVAKRIVVRWHLTFHGKVKFASLCMCMSPKHLNGKIVENFKGLHLWSHWA